MNYLVSPLTTHPSEEQLDAVCGGWIFDSWCPLNCNLCIFYCTGYEAQNKS